MHLKANPWDCNYSYQSYMGGKKATQIEANVLE